MGHSIERGRAGREKGMPMREKESEREKEDVGTEGEQGDPESWVPDDVLGY